MSVTSRFLKSGVVALLILSLAGCQPAPTPPPAAPSPAPRAEVSPAATKPPAPSPTAAATPKPPAPAASPTPQPLRKIKVGTASPSPNMLPLFYADEKGIFKKHGLDVSVEIILGGNTPLAALLADEVQVLSISAEGLSAKLAGQDIVYILSTLPAPAFSMYSKAEITDPSQLKGKTIAVSSINSSSENFARYVAAKAGLAPGDVEIAYTGTTANSLTALTSGKADAGVFSSPSTLVAEKQGFRELANGAKVGWKYLGSSSLVKSKYAAEHYDIVLAYVKAMIEATAAILKDRSGAIEVMGKSNNITDQTILNMSYEEYAPLYLRVPVPPREGIQAALSDLAKTNPAAAGANPAQFVDERFVRELESNGFIKQVFGG